MNSLIARLYDVYLNGQGVVTDTRKITPGCIFFGLKGERVDGSIFGSAALDAGATLAVVRRESGIGRNGIIEVDDPLVALQQLARHHREQLKIPVIGITGSNGKTTTKELIHRILSSEFRTCATQGNLNNHIGVPLTLLSINPQDELAVVEMGANHPGEIRDLCTLALPTHGLVTNIGKAHLEGFGDIAGVKRTKSELYEYLARNSGIAFVNTDEPYLNELSHAVSNRIFYSFGKKPFFSQDRLQFVSRATTQGYDIVFFDRQDNERIAHSTLFGSFNLANIASAIAVSVHFKVPGEKICHAISSYRSGNNRAQRITIGSNEFILDAYNANPSSMALAIRSFDQITHPHKIMILGAMMELGDITAEEHHNIVRHASDLTGMQVIFVGEHFRLPARQKGLDWYPDIQELTDKLRDIHPKDALIFVKGSRAMQLERVLAAFQ